MMKPQKIAAGEFKAKCLKLLDQVQMDKTPLIITKRGKPVARLLPMTDEVPILFGMMRGSVQIKGDIIDSVHEAWEADL